MLFAGFFLELRSSGVPVTLREYLTLLEGVQKGVCELRVESFYALARTTMIKDERYLDRFDRVFAHWFEGALKITDPFRELPEEWLRAMGERYLSEEERAQIQAMGGWRELIETLKKRLEEQKEKHQGGSKWIGTKGTSPFGAFGFNPAGVRIGQGGSRNRTAVKVWEERRFRDYDDRRELGTRDMKMALRRLRKLAREGRPEELDLDSTIDATAKNGGWLDLVLQAERTNHVKILLLLDVGGSMDDHVYEVQRLFSACRAEFKHLEHWYFHNFTYEFLWRDNALRFSERTPTLDVLHTYGRDYKLIFVGDASMSPYEIVMPGGAVEHWNEEAGHVWMRRFLDQFPDAVWLNPVRRRAWDYVESIAMIRELMEERMFPLTIAGLDAAMRELSA